jgi:hypothetical protein
MVRTLLIRGLLVGLLAGLLSLGFAEVFGEHQVDQAINFESQEALARGEAPDPVLVSRDIQKSAGLATAVLIYGTAFGGLFALAFAVAYGRIGRVGPRATAALVAAGGYLVLFVVPFLKYPANPPSIGNPDTIGRRTELYFIMILVSLIVAILAVRLGRWLLKRTDSWSAALLAGGLFIGVMAVVMLILPVVNEVPAAFPATVLWRFRLASLGTQLVLWTTMGLVFGWLTERSWRPVSAARPARAVETA